MTFDHETRRFTPTGLARLEATGASTLVRAALVRFVEDGAPPEPGDFLEALLSNDLRRTFELADSENIHAIRGLLAFLYNHAPSGCWGRAGVVGEWCERQVHIREEVESKRALAAAAAEPEVEVEVPVELGPEEPRPTLLEDDADPAVEDLDGAEE